MATATAPRAKRGKAQGVKVTPQEVLAIEADASAELAERASVMRELTLGALAGKNIHQLGPPGSGKSYGMREWCKRIVGAEVAGVNCAEDSRYFEKAVHAQMPADAIIGGYDMPRFAASGEFVRNVEHYAPNAHFIFLDEVTRANGPTLDALLPLLNTSERQFEANGGMKKAPCLFVVSASNFMPDPDDAHLGALVDRFTLMQYIDYVKADESFKQMLTRAHDRRQQEDAGTRERKLISLDQFREAQRQVNAIALSSAFLEAYASVRKEAKTEGLKISDRRWVELADISRASAWLAGRAQLLADDIAAIEAGLWRERDEIPIAHKLVLPFHGRFEREATKKRDEAAKALATWEEIRPQVEGTPPGQDLSQEVITKSNNAMRQLAAVKKRVMALLDEAEAEKRDAASLRELNTELDGVKAWYEANDLPCSIP
jgi:MoxR-like ATPase